ncbi:MAG: hypothetical protein U5K37_09080 [Natrialbaceae archaeon]|nr:hypothetical protein [Natrialbaceae archaeon]
MNVTADSPVVGGETATVTATVENTGGVQDTQDVTVSVADESTTQSVTLDAGDTTTVALDWATTAGDAGRTPPRPRVPTTAPRRPSKSWNPRSSR